MAGRRRKPTTLKVLEGNAGKRKLEPEKEPQPDELLDLKPPTHLLPAAKKLWNDLAPKLVKLGLLRETDYIEFSILCQSWAFMLQSETTIKSEKQCLTSKLAGGKYTHPAVNNRSQYVKQIKDLCSKFGLSPQARSGMHVKLPDAEGATDDQEDKEYFDKPKSARR